MCTLFACLSLIVLKDFIIFYSDNSDIAVLDDDEVEEVKEKAGQEEVVGVEVMVEGVEEAIHHIKLLQVSRKLSSIVKKEKEKPEQLVKKKLARSKYWWEKW